MKTSSLSPKSAAKAGGETRTAFAAACALYLPCLTLAVWGASLAPAPASVGAEGIMLAVAQFESAVAAPPPPPNPLRCPSRNLSPNPRRNPNPSRPRSLNSSLSSNPGRNPSPNPNLSLNLKGRAVTHVLMGHSFGGLFALSTMASRPELFDAWVAADPSLWWDGGVLIRMLEDKPAAGHSGAFVYAGFGSALRKTGGTTASRNLASEDRFRAALEGFAGPDAKVVVEDYPRETHGTIAVPVFHEAMKRLLIGGAAAGR